MLKQIISSTVVAASLAATISSASAFWGGCDEWQCGSNGLSRNGVALNGVQLDGVQVRQLSVKAVILPSGETIDLR